MNAENKLLQEQESAIPKRKKRNIVWIFDIVGTVVALAAVIISLVTLYEMKIQRNNAYMPTIVFETVDVNTFNTDGKYDNIIFSTRNIGVGVAKKITYSMDSSNLIRWLEYYNKERPHSSLDYLSPQMYRDAASTPPPYGEFFGAIFPLRRSSRHSGRNAYATKPLQKWIDIRGYRMV